MKILALITARGGSKRIPNKNIKLLGGKPLIWYTMEALRNSSVEVAAITSDCPMVMNIAYAFPSIDMLRYRGIVPIVRPIELAQDDTEHIDVLRHALAQFPTGSFDAVLTLQPTSPFRSRYNIEQAIDGFEVSGGKNLVSVGPDGVRNAAIYITPVSELAESDRVKIYNPDSLTYGMDEISSLDINTPQDWEMAEEILWNNPHLGI